MNWLIYYLLIINCVAFAMYAADKKKAKKGAYRISERTLLGVAVIGGSAGAWLAMQICRHKTKKAKFGVGVPVIFILQVASALVVYYKR